MNNLKTGNLRELRQNIMITVNSVETLQSSRQISLVRTNLQEAMMFTGNFMKYAKLGDNPYAKSDGNRKDVKDIQPLFDATENIIYGFEITSELNRIQKVDKLREVIQSFIDFFTEFMYNFETTQKLTDTDEFNLMICTINIQGHLMKSKMWLGMELGAIKDNSGK